MSVALLLSLLPFTAQSTTLDNIGGYVNLSEVRTSTEAGPTATNLRQEYRARWNESLSEYLRIEAGYRYYSLDQSQAGQLGIWRKENLPSVRIDFNHPLFTISSNAQERTTTGQASFDDLTQKNFDIGLRTRTLSLPLLSTGYARVHNYGQPGEAGKNLLEERWSVSVDQTLNQLDWRYNFSHAINDNRVTLLETRTTSHQFRSTYTDMSIGSRRYGYSAVYQIDHSSQTDRLPNSQTLIHQIPILNALYLDQGDPLVGELEIVSSLTDGIKAQPTTPRIEIGAGQTGRQIGVDLGNNRSIGALYIYCDQISDENLQWGIYTSDDNFNWQPHDLIPAVVFNTIENRYEILFDSVSTQYLKAVNRGFNQIDSVVVTELEALQRVFADSEITQSNTSHLISLSSVVRLSEMTKFFSDITYRRDPSVGLVGRQDKLYATNRLSHRHSDVTTSSVIFQQNYQLYEGVVADVSDYSLQYNLRYNPLATLNMSWAATGRISNFDHSRNSEDLNFSWRGNGTPLPGLSVRMGTSYGHNRRILIDQTSNSWRRQISFDGPLTNSVTATFSYDYLQTMVTETGTELKKDHYSASLSWRLTSQINLQGTLDFSRGGYRYESKEFFANWRLSNSISVSGMYSRAINSDGSTTDRKSFSTNWRISNRMSAYLSYIDNNFSQIGREQSSSLQFGLRMSF